MGWDQGQTTWFHFYLLEKKKKNPKKLSNKNMQLMVHHKVQL